MFSNYHWCACGSKWKDCKKWRYIRLWFLCFCTSVKMRHFLPPHLCRYPSIMFLLMSSPFCYQSFLSFGWQQKAYAKPINKENLGYKLRSYIHIYIYIYRPNIIEKPLSLVLLWASAGLEEVTRKSNIEVILIKKTKSKRPLHGCLLNKKFLNGQFN